ncbi:MULTISPECIES: AAA family ATPase [unclassified Streptococcus]|uniref:AAA family ATPase n=1 Tax=unclassified Streptococcus TaxID=2608887 RepID=UPI00211B6C1C|nr:MULTISPECIES: ATP-dependent Clp protease ATP-binding subunit [unclassified Streptococcus]MCQ9212396.1 ATP-dependent Clp protease ATP-binding subunit [Streptococcus sp. B01]MCQ9213736.1 ATP-dependent Clp protease ATP-binding subunit [Streptococcus sp. O1]
MKVSKTPFLDEWTDNFTEKIRSHIDEFEVYGRDQEIERVVISLLRKTKNNPVLVGDAGVGKTAIVEGLTVRIIKGEIPQLKGITVRSLELSRLMEKGKERFISLFRSLIHELKETKNENLLFVDEIHTLIGAGGEEGNALDAGNIIKPALARGEIQLIGATTGEEYQDYIEEDKALERRIQQIYVAEPSIQEAISILERTKQKFEQFHQVRITSKATEQAVLLSVRYLPGRYLPDKAFDLLDEAATLATYEQKEVVTEREIARVLKYQTGIPVTTILKDDTERFGSLVSQLKKQVKGQDEAIQVVVDAVTIAQAGLQDEERPLSSFLFLGMTGVGKTELSKALAFALFDSEASLVRLDMSEFSQRGSSLRLIGEKKNRTKGLLTDPIKHRPYSVVLIDEIEKGSRDTHDLLLQVLDAGRLTDGYGRLISFKNTFVIMTTNIGAEEIKNQLDLKGPLSLQSLKDQERFQKAIALELELFFRPEFLNRIQHKIVFNILDQEVIKEIVVKNFEAMKEKMRKKGLTLSYDQAVLDYLSEKGVDPKNGARPLGRVMDQEVLVPIARRSLEFQEGENYHFSLSIKGEKPDRFHREEGRTIHFDISKRA